MEDEERTGGGTSVRIVSKVSDMYPIDRERK